MSGQGRESAPYSGRTGGVIKVASARYQDAARRGLTFKQARAELGVSTSGLRHAEAALGLHFTRHQRPDPVRPVKAPGQRGYLRALTEAELELYRLLRRKLLPVGEALRMVGRPDLATAWRCFQIARPK